MNNRQAFTTGGRYVVRKSLKVGEQVLQPGDAFPWKELGFDERRVHTLYSGRFIETAPEEFGVLASQATTKQFKQPVPKIPAHPKARKHKQ